MPAPAPAPTSPPRASTDAAAVEALILEHHNAQRAAHGLAPFQQSSCLDGVARSWSVRLASTGRLHHNPSYADQTLACVAWRAAAENVAYNPSPTVLTTAWMQSGPHRANILDPALTVVGIGVTIDAAGTIWATVDFAG
ncbi:MAG: CAP domain-containing protein [Acidimicrobiia bacterium]|nr:CAP domain-containing protein [Acidimicrobiia bacterium]